MFRTMTLVSRIICFTTLAFLAQAAPYDSTDGLTDRSAKLIADGRTDRLLIREKRMDCSRCEECIHTCEILGPAYGGKSHSDCVAACHTHSQCYAC